MFYMWDVKMENDVVSYEPTIFLLVAESHNTLWDHWEELL